MKDISIKIPVDDCLCLMRFLKDTIEVMRDNPNLSIKDDLAISVVERLAQNIGEQLIRQTSTGDIDEAIEYLESCVFL